MGSDDDTGSSELTDEQMHGLMTGLIFAGVCILIMISSMAKNCEPLAVCLSDYPIASIFVVHFA